MAQRPERDARVLIDVALADLDEPAEFREAGEPHWYGFRSQRVEHDVDAVAPGQFHDRVGEIRAARIDDMLDAENLQQRALRGASGAGDDLGSEVVGEVTEAVPLRKVGGQAKLAVRFTDLVLPSGSSVPIEASFVGQGRSETGRDAATIGGAAAGGAILGRVLNKGDRSKGAVIGAIIGAVVGTAVASRTPGEEVTIDEGAVVDLKLDEAVEIRPRR